MLILSGGFITSSAEGHPTGDFSDHGFLLYAYVLMPNHVHLHLEGGQTKKEERDFWRYCVCRRDEIGFI